MSLALPCCRGSACPRRDVHWPRRDKDRPRHCTTLHPPLSWVKRAWQWCRHMIAVVWSAVVAQRRQSMGSAYIWGNWTKLNLENTVVGAVLEPKCQQERRRGSVTSFAWWWHWNSVLRSKRACKSDGGKWRSIPRRRNTLNKGCRAWRVLVPLEGAQQALWDELEAKEERYPSRCPQLRILHTQDRCKNNILPWKIKFLYFWSQKSHTHFWEMY